MCDCLTIIIKILGNTCFDENPDKEEMVLGAKLALSDQNCPLSC